MIEGKQSYRRILASSSLIGGASVINILVGILRTKILAILLGPLGVALTSLYVGLTTSATAFATMGMGTVGTRRIAETSAQADDHCLATARRALFWGTLVLAAAGALAVWSLRAVLASWVLGSAAQASVIGWLSIGVALSVASASQSALIQGMRRVGDLAKLTVFASILSTVLGVAIIWQWRDAGIVGFVLIAPLASFVLGHYYVSKLPKNRGAVTATEIVQEWKTLARFGVAFVGAEAVASLTQLWIRVDVGNVLGSDSLGCYQAAWTISTQYIAFVLGAMAADYYPRLTAIISDHKAASRLVNEQTEIAVLLSAPVFLLMMSSAPWVIRLLYTSSFAPAVEVLRWQILGDVLKVASWPLGFVILAAGDGKSFFWSECLAWIVMAALIVGLVPAMGLSITGIGSLVCYMIYLPLVYVLARGRIGFRWSPEAFRSICLSSTLCAAIFILVQVTQWGWLIGSALAVVFGIAALKRVFFISGLAVQPTR